MSRLRAQVDTEFLTGFPYEALTVTIGHWAGDSHAHRGFPSCTWKKFLAHNVMFFPTGDCVCHTVCNTLISSAGSEAALAMQTLAMLLVQSCARFGQVFKKQPVQCRFFLRGRSRNAQSNIYGNIVENAIFFQPSDVQGRIACWRLFSKSSFGWFCFALFCPVWWDCREWESEPSQEDWQGRVDLTAKGICEQSSNACRYNEGNNFPLTFTD